MGVGYLTPYKYLLNSTHSTKMELIFDKFNQELINK